MRAAPAVSVRCTGGPLWRAWCAGLPVLAAAALVSWGFGHAGLPGLAAGATVCVVGLLLAWAWWRRPSHTTVLAWDGQEWTVDGHPGALAVMLDLGGWLLLRLRLGGRPSIRWVPVSAREAGTAWHGLRAAAFAPPPQSPEAARPSTGNASRG